MRFRAIWAPAIATLAIAGVAASGCGGDDDSDGSEPVDISGEDFVDMTGESAVAVDAVDNKFDPQYVEVSAGTAVTFKNDGRNQHNVIPTESGSFTPIETDEFAPGADATITFDEPGDYAYYCTLHGTKTRGMVGGIRVVE